MDIILGDITILNQLDNLKTQMDVANGTMALFTDDRTPLATDVLGNFTEANFAGYSRQPLDAGTIYRRSDGQYAFDISDAHFQANGTGNLPQTVYGAMLLDVDDGNRVIGAGRLDNPVTLNAVDDGVTVDGDASMIQTSGTESTLTVRGEQDQGA